MNSAEYSKFDALGLAEVVRRREVTAGELVEAAISLIERHNPALNAVIFKAYDSARSMAKTQPGPGMGALLQGVPMLLKDASGDCLGMPTTFGSRALAGIPPADHDSEQVARFKAGGLIPLGKTNVPEWGFIGTTEPFFYGPTSNPWSTGHSPGGSSGGSAAAVAAGIVPIAHGNDGGGSIRIPASACGLVGLKPSRGRVSMGPVIGEWIDGFTCEHVLTRSVRDCAAVLDLTAGAAPGDPYGIEPPARSYLDELPRRPSELRIAYWTSTPTGEAPHQDCREAVLKATRLCEDLGHHVDEAAPEANLEELLSAFMVTYLAGAHFIVDFATEFLSGKKPAKDDLEPLSWAMAERGRAVSVLDYQVAATTRQMIARAIAAFHETYDVWLTPTLASPPVPTGTYTGAITDVDAVWRYHPFTPIQNATGQPSISLPLHWNADGLPVGTMFSSALGNEAILLRLAAQLEEAQPWIGRKPPVSG